MKKTVKVKAILKIAGIIALVAIIGCMAVSCGGGGNPKSLAKEGLALTKEAFKIGAGEDVDAANAYMKKAEAHREKVEKLSAEQKKVYETELLRLFEAERD